MSLKQMQALDANKEALAQPEQEQFALKHRIAELEGAVIGLQTQRRWVGLTEEEIEGFVNALWPVGAGAGKLLRAIEAKLREKNR